MAKYEIKHKYYAFIFLASFLIIPTAAQASDDNSDKPEHERKPLPVLFRDLKGHDGSDKEFKDGDTAPRGVLIKRLENREKIRENRCDKAEDIINNRIKIYQKRREFFIDRYQILKERLTNLASRLDKEGYDVSQLTTDLDTADTKLTALTKKYTEFINSLTELQSLECGNSDGKFADKLKETKEMLVEIKTDVLALRKFFETTIKDDIKDLKDQIKDKKDSTTTDQSDTESQD
jgi:hypothetical protein